MPQPDTVQLAIERYKSILRWRNLWTILLFVFGATVVIFLCTAILFFITKSFLPGALTTLTTIVNGVGMSWVKARRDEAVKEEIEAYDEYKALAGAAKTASGASFDDVEAELEQFKRKLHLIGRIR